MIKNTQVKETKSEESGKKKGNNVYYNVKKHTHIINVWKKQ